MLLQKHIMRDIIGISMAREKEACMRKLYEITMRRDSQIKETPVINERVVKPRQRIIK